MTIGSVAAGLHGAFLLARGRAEGLRFLFGDMDAAARSFWAMAVAAPAIVAMRLLVWATESGIPANAARVLARDLLVYLVSWLAFAIVSARMAERLGRGALWPGFVATWNWCNVAGDIMMLAAALPRALGAPPMVDQAVQLAAIGWVLWLEWYAVRLSLRTGPLLGAYIVAVDQIVGLSFAVAGSGLGPK